ncbi:alpha/beta hydrolase [Nostoc sp. NIES-2111]
MRLLLNIAVLILTLPGFAAAAPAVPMETYTTPAELVRLPDGRRMNLFCLGAGTPAVILDAGAGQGTSAWATVQAEIAETTQVCAFDRAGLGFSSPGPLPRDAMAMVADEKAMLEAAGIDGPFVLVGHSLAGFNVELFTYLHRSDVAGIVLVDPSVPHWDRRVAQIAPTMAASGAAARAKRRSCADRVIAGELGPTAPAFTACFPPPPEGLPATVREVVLARQLDKDMHRTINSELDSEEASSAEVERHRRQLGDLPVVVLTAVGQTYPPTVPDGEKAARAALWTQGHAAIAALSSRGEQRRVDSGHYIGQTRPDAIVAAVRQVVEAARSGNAEDGAH